MTTMVRPATSAATLVRWWALLSASAGIAANVFLVLFYVTAKPWLDLPGPPGWFGRANDSLVVVQYAALLPVVLGLGRLMPADVRARTWTRVGLVATASLIVLQILLLTRTLPFAIQVIPASVCVIASVLWAGGISGAGIRTGTLPEGVARAGRILAVALSAGAVIFIVVFILALATGVSWLWVAGALPGAVVFFLFPGWALLLVAVGPLRRQPSARGEPFEQAGRGDVCRPEPSPLLERPVTDDAEDNQETGAT